MTDSTTLPEAGRPGPEQRPTDRLTDRLFAPLASFIQSLSAFIQLGEPLRTLVFAATLLLTSFIVIRKYGRPPTWFMGGILLAFALFAGMTPSGRAWALATAKSIGQSRVVEPVATPVPSPKNDRYVSIVVFLDQDGDGAQSENEVAMPIALEIWDGEPHGASKLIRNPSGVTGPQSIPTRGLVVVRVCGISQAHEVSQAHLTAGAALPIAIGISDAARALCT